MDLHGQIMNLRCDAAPETAAVFRDRGMDRDAAAELAYKLGHRDARHASAELALDAEAERDELLALLRKARDEFKGMPRSLGYEFTHLREIEVVLERHGFAAG